ncbi:MAG: hypothetical protein NTZ67_06750 [Gammaproteobacteria bacterium]|nr:hypothetical protein [Gammaproteobacteria bacterium]
MMFKNSPLPQYAKPLGVFQDVNESAPSSAHTTKIVKKKHKKELWVFKQFDKNPEELSQIEAAMATFHRALSGPVMTPKLRPVYTQEDQSSQPVYFATVSKMFPGFMDLQVYLGDDFGAQGKEKETDEKLKALVQGGLGRVLKFAFLLGEGDLHKGNVGVILKKQNGENCVESVVRVDFDCMPEPMLSQAHLRGLRNASHVVKFAITARDINDFPVLKDAEPYYWPTLFRLMPDLAGKLSLIPAHGYTSTQTAVFSTLKNDLHFREDSFFADLIFELFPDECRNNIFSAYITDLVIVETFSQYFSARKKESKRELQKSTKFKTFWENINKDAIETIRNAFLTYNTGLKEKHQNLEINMTQVSQSYYAFCRTMAFERISNSMTLLWEVTILYHPRTSGKSEYEYLTGLRKALHDSYELFSRINELSSSDVADFFREMINPLKGLDSMTLTGSSEQCGALKSFLDSIYAALRDLITHCSFINPSFEHELNQLDDLFPLSHCSGVFDSVPVLKLSTLVDNVRPWLFQMKVEKEKLWYEDSLEKVLNNCSYQIMLSRPDKNEQAFCSRGQKIIFEFDDENDEWIIHFCYENKKYQKMKMEKNEDIFFLNKLLIENNKLECFIVGSPKEKLKEIAAFYATHSFELVNKHTMLVIFNSFLEEFRKNAACYGAQVSAVTSVIGRSVVSTAGFFSSFWSKSETIEAAPLVLQPLEQLIQVQQKIKESKNSSALQLAMNDLLLVYGEGVDAFRNKFFSRLVSQFSNEFSAAHIFSQMQRNPNFAEYLKDQVGEKLSESDMLRAVELLKAKIAPSSRMVEPYEDGDVNEWEELEVVGSGLRQ